MGMLKASQVGDVAGGEGFTVDDDAAVVGDGDDRALDVSGGRLQSDVLADGGAGGAVIGHELRVIRLPLLQAGGERGEHVDCELFAGDVDAFQGQGGGVRDGQLLAGEQVV